MLQCAHTAYCCVLQILTLNKDNFPLQHLLVVPCTGSVLYFNVTYRPLSLSMDPVFLVGNIATDWSYILNYYYHYYYYYYYWVQQIHSFYTRQEIRFRI
jgi:hypothetical protein